MFHDREGDKTRAPWQVDPRTRDSADGFPELPLGVEAFRSPLHTLPSSPPAPRRSNEARIAFVVVSVMSVALGVLAAVTIGEPALVLTEAREDLVESPDVPVRAGAIDQSQTSRDRAAVPAVASTPPKPTKPTASALATRHEPTPRAKSKARAKRASRNIPERPSRSAVLAAMRSVTGDARSCLRGTAVAEANITFNGETGKVLTATVRGVTDAAAGCVTRAVRAARLPPFSKARLQIVFPFRAGG